MTPVVAPQVRGLEAVLTSMGENALLLLLFTKDNFGATALGRAAANCEPPVLQWFLDFLARHDRSISRKLLLTEGSRQESSITLTNGQASSILWPSRSFRQYYNFLLSPASS